jgi:hypothetical protein
MNTPGLEEAVYQAWRDLRRQSEALEDAGFAQEKWPLSDRPLDDVDPRDQDERMSLVVHLPSHERKTLRVLAQSYQSEEAIRSRNTDELVDLDPFYDTHVKKVALARATGDKDELLSVIDSIWDELLDVRNEVAEAVGNRWVRDTSPYNHQLLERIVREIPTEVELEPSDDQHGEERWPDTENRHAGSALDYDYHRLVGISVNRPRSHRKREDVSAPTARTLAKMSAGLEVHPALFFFDDALLGSLVDLFERAGDIKDEIENEESFQEYLKKRRREELIEGEAKDGDSSRSTGRFEAEFGSEAEREFISHASQLASRIGCQSVGGVTGAAIGLVSGSAEAVLLAHLFDGKGISMPKPFRLSDLADLIPRDLSASPPDVSG